VIERKEKIYGIKNMWLLSTFEKRESIP
jgi:hypothetical protein